MIITIILFALCLVLLFLTYRKKVKNTQEEQDKREIAQALQTKIQYLDSVLSERAKDLEGLNEEITKQKDRYQSFLEKMEQDREKVVRELTETKERKSSDLEKSLEIYKKTLEAQKEEELKKFSNFSEEKQQEIDELESVLEDLEEDYENFLSSFKLLEKEEQALLFMTIQVSDSEKKDIAFLVNEVFPKISHPDILSKLIWSEFIQKSMTEMLARTKIDDGPGIYKITNLKNKKCYIGKSTNVKRRLQEHVKGSLGISTIANQKIHDVMREEGIWNFTFEKILSCEKDQLSTKEKHFIKVFDSINWGYNVVNG